MPGFQPFQITGYSGKTMLWSNLLISPISKLKLYIENLASIFYSHCFYRLNIGDLKIRQQNHTAFQITGPAGKDNLPQVRIEFSVKKFWGLLAYRSWSDLKKMNAPTSSLFKSLAIAVSQCYRVIF